MPRGVAATCEIAFEHGAGRCGNCGSSDVILSPYAQLAAFFAKRVLGVEVATLAELVDSRIASVRSGIVRGVASGSVDLLDRATGGVLQTRPPVRADIRICRSCEFIGPYREYTEDQLNGLYADYRSESYNRERTLFEPGYAGIANLVGKSDGEVDARLTNVDRLLREKLDSRTLKSIGSVLDWGGGEGRFVPRSLNDRRVVILDVSSERPAVGAFERVGSQGALDSKFDYIQLCHVLEHVTSPRNLLGLALASLNPGGYLYIEVPQDRNDAELLEMRRLNPAFRHVIHEHLNLYSPPAVRALGAALGLREIAVERTELDIGWSKATVVSGLFQLPERV